LVDFLLDILRVGELSGQVTIVSEQEHTSGVAVESSHGIDALLTGTLDQIHNGLAAIGVIAGGDAIFGFIEQDVALLLGGDNLIVILYNILRGNLHAQLGHDIAVNLYQALLDIFIGHTTRADAGVGHELVEANLHVGIDSGLFIDNALGLGRETHLGLGALTLGALLIATLTLLVTAALALLIATLALLVTAALALLIATLALLVTALTLLVTTLALLVAALALLIAALALLIAALALLVTALTGLITALALLVIALLLFGSDLCSFSISVLFAYGLRLLVALLITRLIATLALLVTALTRLVTTLTLVATLTLLVSTLMTGLITTLTGLITLIVIPLLALLVAFLLLESLGC